MAGVVTVWGGVFACVRACACPHVRGAWDLQPDPDFTGMFVVFVVAGWWRWTCWRKLLTLRSLSVVQGNG